jgi:hypothetical protein
MARLRERGEHVADLVPPTALNGRMRLPETTDLGVELNLDVPWVHPIAD